MFDPRFPPDLAHHTDAPPPVERDEIARVQHIAAQLSSAAGAHVPGIEATVEQLGKTGNQLGALADQMEAMHKSFQAMQNWQNLLEDAFHRVKSET